MTKEEKEAKAKYISGLALYQKLAYYSGALQVKVYKNCFRETRVMNRANIWHPLTVILGIWVLMCYFLDSIKEFACEYRKLGNWDDCR